jgi:hypothetical protein
MFGPKREELAGCGEKYKIRSFITYTLHQIKGDEMGGSCSTHGKDEKCVQNFGCKT